MVVTPLQIENKFIGNHLKLNNKISRGGNFDPFTYKWFDLGCDSDQKFSIKETESNGLTDLKVYPSLFLINTASQTIFIQSFILSL